MITPGRRRVLAWALWDCGSTGLNAIVVTYVFSVYLTGTVGQGLPGDTSPASWLGRALAASGLLVAVLAPVTGIWVEAPRRRRAALAVLTALVVAQTAAMSLIGDDHRFLWAGLVLLAGTAACGELANVPYNAMLRQLCTPQNSGRISGFGWACGYLGSVLLLLIVYAGFIAGEGPNRGLFGVSTDNGHNVHVVVLLAATWFAVFALPLLLTAPAGAPAVTVAAGPAGGYRRLWAELRAEWRRDRNTIYYLGASAIYRDGLAGVFAFGAVLGVSVYGLSPADVLLFGVTASVVSAVGAVAGGLLDDRLGSKPVIVGSLTAMVAVGLGLTALSGPVAFWLCGLALCLFLGPAQSASRTLMLRLAADGKEGVAFGLYTTTGRAVSFVAPWVFFTFIDAFGTDRAGMAGLCLVVGVGLTALLAVRVPQLSVSGDILSHRNPTSGG